jgi:hypothetical protein
VLKKLLKIFGEEVIPKIKKSARKMLFGPEKIEKSQKPTPKKNFRGEILKTSKIDIFTPDSGVVSLV